MNNKKYQKEKVVVITGCSSGIGFETSLLLARKGFYTYATMRNLNKTHKINDIAKNENLPLKVLQLDVTDDRSVKDAINQIKYENSRIDVLVLHYTQRISYKLIFKNYHYSIFNRYYKMNIFFINKYLI